MHIVCTMIIVFNIHALWSLMFFFLQNKDISSIVEILCTRNTNSLNNLKEAYRKGRDVVWCFR